MPDDLTAELARMRKRLGVDDAFMSCPCGRADHKACRRCPYRHCSVHGIEARLLAAVDAVLAFHVPKTVSVTNLCGRHGAMGWPGRAASREDVDQCPDCRTTDVITCASCNPTCPGDNQWPCPEYLAISRALTGEDPNA